MNFMRRQNIGITLDSKLLSDLDLCRGLIPRSRFIEMLIVGTIKKGGNFCGK